VIGDPAAACPVRTVHGEQPQSGDRHAQRLLQMRHDRLDLGHEPAYAVPFEDVTIDGVVSHRRSSRSSASERGSRFTSQDSVAHFRRL
jgi:hypothetical protein